MRFPDLAAIALIGKRVRRLARMTREAVEHIVAQELGVNHSLEQQLFEVGS
jgi:hypothetical protein